MNIEDADMNFLPALIAAIITVESGGDYRAVGDSGQALGILQIHKNVIQDVNRIYKTHFKHTDALNPVMAREICELYLRHYAPENATAEQCARIWNGGPAGHRKASTEKYWEKVRREYVRIGVSECRSSGVSAVAQEAMADKSAEY